MLFCPSIPALEVDNIEAGLLQEQDSSLGFRVLVTTPEKLDLLLRQGWETKILDGTHFSVHSKFCLKAFLPLIN